MKIIVKITIFIILLTFLPFAAQAKITEVTASPFCVMALDSNGTVWAWGDNQYGFLGIGTMGGSSNYVLNPRKYL